MHEDGIDVYEIQTHEKIKALDLHQYKRLIKHCGSLTKLVRVVARMKMIDQTLPTIDFQPQNPVVLPIGLLKLKPELIQMWSKKIPQETLEHSWKKIVLTSQQHFPPTSKYINKNVLEDGMIVATLQSCEGF